LDLSIINHVYNKRERFFKFRKAYPNNTIYVGDLIVLIKGWESIRIVVKTPTLLKYKTLNLYNIAYIPFFNINIIALYRLIK
jgi:hypothetical protein